MQDSRTRQKLGTSPKVGHMFPMDNLCFPLVAPVSVAAAVVVSSILSLALWYARLSHTSSSWVQHLVSKGLLGSMSIENFNCVSCQLGNNQLCLSILVNQYPLISLN